MSRGPSIFCGRHGIVGLCVARFASVCCVVALAGASQPAVVSAVALSTAVVVHTAVAQGLASGSPF